MASPKYLVVVSCLVVAASGRIWFEGDVLPGTNTTVLGPSQDRDLAEVLRRVESGDRAVLPSLISRGVGRLALQLDKALIPPTANTLFSPLSVALALALVLLGAKGETYSQITNVLGLPENTSNSTISNLHDEFGRLFKMVEERPDENNGCLVTLASGVFVQYNFMIKPAYTISSQSLYNSEVMALDFKTQGKQALEIINSWVSNRTDGHIKHLLSEPLSFDTRVVIVNALYFIGSWENPFVPQWTTKQKFYINGRNFIEIDMMVNAAEAYYYGDKDKKVLGLPYRGNNTVMYFIIPNSHLSSYVDSLDSTQMQEIIANSTYQMAIYTVPKMKLEKTVNLQQALMQMGVTKLFSPEADLSGLAEGVYANSVIHKVEIEVNELGTSASAATAIDLVRSGAAVVRIDKPFLFFIYHKPANIISFWGKVFNPTQA